MIRLGVLYFAIVFTTGFVLGMLRVMLVVPTLGRRYAELLEIPLMLFVVYIVGRWIARRCISRRQAFESGFIALALLLLAEVGLAAVLLNKSPVEALFHKDPVSGTAYYASLVVFAVVPGWLRGRMAETKAMKKE